MTPLRALKRKTFVLIFLMVVFGPFGDVLLRKGMRGVGAMNNWTPAAMGSYFWRTFSSGMIWLGIASLLLFFLSYMLVLSWADYSFVQPASAVSYLVVAVLGIWILGEVVSPSRWLGVAVICLGVFLVGNTPPRTTGLL
jgi:drug/metabolite transporter (DMT)-like permease